jgi:hypothetical protein
MSVRYPEHDCFEDYEEDNVVSNELTKEDMINSLIEYECQTMTVWDLLFYYKHKMREEYDGMSGKRITEIYNRYF